MTHQDHVEENQRAIIAELKKIKEVCNRLATELPDEFYDLHERIDAIEKQLPKVIGTYDGGMGQQR